MPVGTAHEALLTQWTPKQSRQLAQQVGRLEQSRKPIGDLLRLSQYFHHPGLPNRLLLRVRHVCLQIWSPVGILENRLIGRI